MAQLASALNQSQGA